MKTYCVKEEEYNQFIAQLGKPHRILSLKSYLIRYHYVEEDAEINLGKLSLANGQISNADLSHISFSAGNLRGTQFPNSDLSSANFQNTILRHASFEGSNLIGANFTGATFEATNFKNAILISTIGLPEEIIAGAKETGAVTTIEEFVDAVKKRSIPLDCAHSIAKQFFTLAQVQDNTTQKNLYQEYAELLLKTFRTPQCETLYLRSTYGFLTKLGLPTEIAYLILNNVPYKDLSNAASVGSVYEGIGRPEGKTWTDYAILTPEKFDEVKKFPKLAKTAVQGSFKERREKEKEEQKKQANTIT